MSIKDVAEKFTALCREGKFHDAARYWDDGVISVESMPGDMQRLEGRAAVTKKGEWWGQNNEVHRLAVEGPFVNGDQFTVRIEMDVTAKGHGRNTMIEHCVFTVKNDKIVEEKFFYDVG